ncbi:hypothetical protein ACTHGU_10625 [Chitinophagaceae bacterium MMS25-I14]
MNVFHIQVPKLNDRSVAEALNQIKADFQHVPKVQVVEYEQLYIIDGIETNEVRTKMSEALNRLNIPHF